MREGWTYKKLGEVCTVLNGLWIGKKEPLINIAVIRNTNFSKDCKLKLDDVAYIDVEEKQFLTRKLQVGDIIIEKSGGSEKQPVGRPVLFNIPDGDYSFSNFTSTLRLQDKTINPKFLHKCLYGYYRNGETKRLQSKTTGLHNLDIKAYLKLPIPVPPLSEQQRIVSELDLLSSIIEKKKAQLKEYDQLAQSIFYDMFGDPVTNEKGWEVKKVGELTTEMRYGTSRPACEGGKYNYLRMGNINNEGYLNLNDLKKIDIPDNEVEKCIVKRGDVLFNRTNSLELIGKTCLFDLEEPMVIAGYLIRVRFKETILPLYFTRLFNLSEIKKKLRSMAKGAVNQANINAKELASISIPLPPLSLQQSFASKIEAIERQKALIQQSIAEVQMLFDSRMDDWFA